MYLRVLSLLLAMCLLLACSDDNNNPTYPFERSVLEVSIVKKPNYWLKWQHPIEKKDLQSYYIWVDTTAVKDSAEAISQSQMNMASALIPYSGRGDGDSLDLTDFIKDFLDRDSLHIAIWARYGGSDKGLPHHRYIIFGDEIEPSAIHIEDSSAANRIWISWARPTDQSDFYRPEEKNGAIAGYNVTVKAEDKSEDIRNLAIGATVGGAAINANDVKRFQWFKKERRKAALGAVSSASQNILRFAIIDGKGFDEENNNANDWKLEIHGLKPESDYEITIVAFDVSGNSSTAPSRLVSTTDNIAPIMAAKLSAGNLPRFEYASNRLAVFWPRSVDPVSASWASQITNLEALPAGCYPVSCYMDVENYSVEQWNGKAWEAIPRIYPIQSGYYSSRYNGIYASDTLRWIAPGDTVILRIRAIDNSGYYSRELRDTIAIPVDGHCPKNFLPVKKDESVFCMEKLQRLDEKNLNKFKNNVLYIEAKRICESLTGTQGYEGFDVGLCAEREWNAACGSGGSSYGIIEEENFSPSSDLYRYCGVGVLDSVSENAPANFVDGRDKNCKSPDGIRDLPGQLQEWAVGDDGAAILKGTSYVKFEGASRAELALCKNRFTPTRVRPKYTTEAVYLYRTGSRVDTLLTEDPSRILHQILQPSDFKDTLMFYSLKSKDGDNLGLDFVDKREYRRRSGDKWLDVLWQGLEREKKEEKQVLILGSESLDASEIFLNPTVGFRCCANVR